MIIPDGCTVAVDDDAAADIFVEFLRKSTVWQLVESRAAREEENY